MRGTNNGFYFCGTNTINKIAHRQHMCGGNHHRSQFMQCYGSKPVFIVPFQHQHYHVSAANSFIRQNICHLIAVLFDIAKGENMFLILGVAPNKRALFRCFIGNSIDNIISEIKIVRIMQGDFFQIPVLTDQFRTKFLVNAHLCYSLTTSPTPIWRKRSYRLEIKSRSPESSWISSVKRMRMRS